MDFIFIVVRLIFYDLRPVELSRARLNGEIFISCLVCSTCWSQESDKQNLPQKKQSPYSLLENHGTTTMIKKVDPELIILRTSLSILNSRKITLLLNFRF